MTTEEHRCGAEHDPEFFNAILEVFNKFPAAFEKYSIKCTWHERTLLKVDFDRLVGISRIEDGKVVTEFIERSKAPAHVFGRFLLPIRAR